MESERKKRINKILDILKNKVVNTQEDLVKELKKSGIEITQATLSRDLASIGVMRVRDKNGLRYQFNSEKSPILQSVITIEVQEVLLNETSVVIKTLTGCAQSVAVVVDSWNHPDILCTIAGDDTILVLPKSIKYVKRVANYLKREWNLQ
ncbi:MAG TPA: arginine repressor [Bacteroidota bacterium]|nr:arginine repressor [Bacteroidota bacterium]